MSDAMHTLLTATRLLDLHHPEIEALVARRSWQTLRPYDRIGTVYDFVRNEIAFGYNEGRRVAGVQGAGRRQRASSSTSRTWPACSAAFRRHDVSAATAPLPPTYRRPGPNGKARTPTSRGKASQTTSGHSTCRSGADASQRAVSGTRHMALVGVIVLRFMDVSMKCFSVVSAP